MTCSISWMKTHYVVSILRLRIDCWIVSVNGGFEHSWGPLHEESQVAICDDLEMCIKLGEKTVGVTFKNHSRLRFYWYERHAGLREVGEGRGCLSESTKEATAMRSNFPRPAKTSQQVAIHEQPLFWMQGKTNLSAHPIRNCRGTWGAVVCLSKFKLQENIDTSELLWVNEDVPVTMPFARL